MSREMIIVSEEVQEALESARPVVALESTIISHGMPFPENLATALDVEQTVRSNGAIPATIAVIDGKIRIGLDSSSMQVLATESNVMKLSRRDLPYAVSERRNGATTVAATMIAAELAGISIFATGGIGGVHRGASQSFDISADLIELSKTPVAVVSAGAKSILDIPSTLEYLETFGVPVIGYKSEYFAAFYTASSGIPLEMVMNTPDAVARFLHVKWALGLKGGVLISNPVQEQFQINEAEMSSAIEKAMKEAEEKGIKGKDVTPFLLQKVKSISQGKSLETNISLIMNNAALAAQIASAYSIISK